MHMAKGTIVSLFTVSSAYTSSAQCREATSGNRVEEAGVDLGGGGGGDHKYIWSPPPLTDHALSSES